MNFEIDRDADAGYLRLSNEPVSSGRDLDERRRVDLGQAGRPVGIEFLSISGGIDLTGLADAGSLALAITETDPDLTVYSADPATRIAIFSWDFKGNGVGEADAWVDRAIIQFEAALSEQQIPVA